jgi:topoisomerase-4 subunit B
MKSAQKVEKRKGSGVAVLPGKLTDCESTTSRDASVPGRRRFAGGSAKLARDKQYQAILPLRGKVLNTSRWSATGCSRTPRFTTSPWRSASILTAPPPRPISKGLRYSKIIIMADADVDGSHIKVLLLTLFFRISRR